MKQFCIKDVIEKAKKVLISTGKHIPQFIGYSKEGLIVGVLMFNNSDEGDMAIDFVRKTVSSNNIKRYWIIMEAWKTNIKPGEKIFRGARRDIDRTECLVISEFNSDMKNIVVCISFKRVDNKIVFEKEQTTKESHCMWNVYLEKEGVRERMNKDIQDINDAFIKKMSKDLAHKYKDDFSKAKSKEEIMKVVFKAIIEGKKKIDDQKKTMFEDVEDNKKSQHLYSD